MVHAIPKNIKSWPVSRTVESNESVESDVENRRPRRITAQDSVFRDSRISRRFNMLVLSRKLNEKIVIDGGIVITVVKIDRNQVRLGIEAPNQVGVYREEIILDARRGNGAQEVQEAVTVGA
jgi:carbon storage regulator